ncbi:hypothetical protein HDU87_006864 [Geranomyces variabilis]|uniref:Uncharacterized protein n=1 Tax=Geranomyces variabilis TaxID=109894 RepID=A0AAD5TSU7_9FUNG|nr:hypothetical protein HDU87_006864 [Geranomyces variabilis]
MDRVRIDAYETEYGLPSPRESSPFLLQRERHYEDLYSPRKIDEDDPDVILNTAVEESWSLHKPRVTWIARVRQWYKPVYDYKTPGLTDVQRRRPLYCNGKFKSWQFYALHAVVIGFVLTIILVPAIYCVVVPHIIQGKLDEMDTSALTITKMDVLSWNPDGLRFAFSTALPAQMFIPLHVKLGAMAATIGNKNDFGSGWAQANIPELSLRINEEMKLDMEGDLVVKDVTGLQGLIRDMSSKTGVSGLVIRAKFPATIEVWGIKFYKNLPLHKDLVVPALASGLQGLYDALPNALRAKNLNYLIRRQVVPNDLLTFPNTTLPDIAIQEIGINMTDSGLSLRLGVAFENPTVIAVKLPTTTAGLTIQNQTIAFVTLRDVELTSGLNNMTMGLDVAFAASEGQAMGKLVGSVINYLIGKDDGEDLSPSVVGPVSMTGTDFVAGVTKPMALSLPVQAALEAFHIDKLKGLLSADSGLLASTNFSASVTSTQIGAAVALALPRLIPLPPIDFNYVTSVSVQGAMNVLVQPIQIRTDLEKMTVTTAATVVPVNSDQAATDLANTINPILQSNPQPSSINLSGLSFANPSAASTGGNATTGVAGFTWANTVFKSTVMPVPLPGICVKCMVETLTKNGTSLPVDLRSMDVHQLTDVSGFAATGQIGVKYPAALTRLDMNIGYASVAVNVGGAQVPLIGVELPTGLKFVPDPTGNETAVSLAARMVVQRDPRLSSALQSFVDGFVSDAAPTDLSTSVMITAIQFGASATDHFNAFSKIAVSIDAHDFRDMAVTIGKALAHEAFSEKLVTMNDISVDIVAPTQVNLGVKAQVRNPVDIGLSIGRVSLVADLDDTMLSGVNVSPITLATGTGAFALNVVTSLATGANGMADKVAGLVQSILSGTEPTTVLGVNGFTMFTAGNGTSANASVVNIDQFSSLKLHIPPSMLRHIIGAVDISALFGTTDNILDGFGVALARGSIATLPQATVAFEAGLSLANALPVSARVPYVQIIMTLNGLDFVVVDVLNITLIARGTAFMQPSVSMRFVDTNGIQDQVATFINAFIDGHVMEGVGVKSILFGNSAQSTNDLLSAVNLDMTKLTQGIDTSALIAAGFSMLLGKDISFPMDLVELIHTISELAVGTIHVETLPGKAVSADLGGMKLALPFTLDANIGTLGANVGVNGASLMSLGFPSGIKMATSQITALAPLVQFTDEEPARDKLAEVARWLFEAVATDASFDVRSLTLGLSMADRITSFDKVQLAIPVSRLLKPQADISPLLGMFAPSITKVDIATAPGNAMSLAAGLQMTSPIQIAANIGWVGVHVGIDNNPLVDVGLPNLALAASTGATALNVATTLAFKDTDATRDAVARMVDGVVNGGDAVNTAIGVGSLVLGGSEQDVITAFSKMEIPFRLTTLLNRFGVKTPIDYAQAKDFLSIAVLHAGVNVNSGKSVAVDASANIAVIPFPTTVNIGHLGASVGINDKPLIEVNLPGGIHIDSNTTGISADVAFVDNSGTQYALADAVDGLLNGPKINGAVDVRNLQLGYSAQDRITLLDKVNLRIDLDALCAGVGLAVPLDITQVLGSSNPTVGTLHVKTLPKQTMAITASADLKLPLPFPVDLHVGYVFAGATLGTERAAMHPLADFSLPSGLALHDSAFAADFAASLVFRDQEATRDAVAEIVDGLFNSGIKDGWLGVNGIEIGASNNDLITAFSKIRIDLSLVRILEQMRVPSPLDINNIAGRLNATLGEVAVATAPAASLDVTATLGFTLPLPFAITFDTGFFGARTILNGVALAGMSMPGLSFAAGDGGRSELAVRLKMNFQDSDSAESEIAHVVDNVLHTTQVGATVGVDGIIFGYEDNAEDWIRVLAKAKVAVPIDPLLRSFGVHLPLDLTSLPSALNATIDDTVQLRTLLGAEMGVKAAASFKLPFEVALNLGYVGVRVNVNGAGLVSVALPGFRVDSKDARSSLNIDTSVQFESSSAVRSELAKVVDDVLAGKLTSSIGIDRLVFGASASDVITILDRADLALPLSALVHLSGPLDLGQMAANYLREALIDGSSTNSTSGLTIKHASIAAEVDDNLHVTAAAFVPLQLPFGIDLQMGYVGLREIKIDSTTIMEVDVNGFSYSGGDVAVDAKVHVEDGKDVRNKLAKVSQGDGHGGFPGTLGLSGLVFGANSEDVIESFSEISLKAAISPVGQVISQYATNLLNTFLSGVPGNGAIQIDGSSGIQIHLSQSMALVISHVGVQFRPANLISCAVDGSLQFPFDLAASLPFLDVAIGLDNTPVMQIGITGLNIAGGQNTLKLGTDLTLRDDDAVQTKVAAIAQAIMEPGAQLPGTISISGLKIGVSARDSIDAFSDMVLSLPLDKIVGPFIRSSASGQSNSAYVSDIKLDHIGIRSAKQRTLALDLKGGMSNALPISISGLNYISTNAGIDAVDLMTVSIPGLSIQQGENSLTMDLSIAFAQGQSVQDAIAKFLGDAYTLGWGNTPETLALANLRIGYSKDDHISTFAKARIGFASARVLSAPNVDWLLSLLGMSRGDFTTAKFFPRIDIRGAQLSIDDDNRLVIAGKAALTGFTVDANMAFPFMSASIGMSGAHLANAAMKDFMMKQEGGNLAVQFTMTLDFPTNDLGAIQTVLATLVSDMQNLNGVVGGALEMSGFQFGLSQSDSIDALGTCRGELAMQDIGTAGTRLFNAMLKTAWLDLIDIAPIDAAGLQTDVVARFTPYLPGVTAAIPFLSIDVRLDNNRLITAEATEIHVAESGQVLSKAEVRFDANNRAGAQTVTAIAGNMIFRMPQTITSSLSFGALRFGKNKEHAVKLFDGINITFDLPWFIGLVTAYMNRPENMLNIADIHGTVTPEGIAVKATITPLPAGVPFRSRPGASAFLHVIHQGQNAVELLINSVDLAPGRPVQLDLLVKTIEPNIIAAANTILPQLLEFTSFTTDLQIGRIGLTMGDPQNPTVLFSAFDQAHLTPPPLFMFEPLTIRPKLVNPFTQGLGLDIFIGMPNGGPLDVNLGKFGVRILDRGTTEIGTAGFTDGIVLKNAAEGGNNAANNEFRIAARLDIERNPLKFWTALIDLLQGAKNYDLEWYSTTMDGAPTPWLQNILANIPLYLKGNIVPIILSLLNHIKIQLGPFTISPPPIFEKLAADILGKLPAGKFVFLDGEAPANFLPAANSSSTVVSSTATIQPPATTAVIASVSLPLATPRGPPAIVPTPMSATPSASTPRAVASAA